MKFDSTFLTETLDALPLFIYRVNLAGELTYANKAFADQLQKEWPELAGKTAFDLHPEIFAKKYSEDDRKVIDSKMVFHDIEENLDAKTEQVKYVEIYKIPMRDSAGDIVGIQGVYWDISQQFLREQKLASNELLFRTIASYSPDNIVLLDQKLDIVYMNKAFLNEDIDSLYGKSIYTLLSPENENEFSQVIDAAQAGACLHPFYASVMDENGEKLIYQIRFSVVDIASLEACYYLTCIDVTQKIEQEKMLRQASVVFEYASEAILVCAQDGEIQNVNQACLDLTGLDRIDLIGKCFDEFVDPKKDQCSLEEAIEKARVNNSWRGELTLRIKGRSLMQVIAAISFIVNDENAVPNVVVLLTDVTAQNKHQEELEHIAHYDALTNLPNRYFFDKLLRMAMDKALRESTTLALLHIDIDNFKNINESHGHQQGDQVLASLARKIESQLGEDDFVGRIGGDQFLVVIPRVESKKEHIKYIARLLDSISRPISIGKHELSLMASVGVTYYPQQEPVEVDHLIRQADLAMYQAKLRSDKRISIFDSRTEKSLKDFGKIRSDMKRALLDGEICLYYQPKINMLTREVLGVEALARWIHPEKGLLVPDYFIPAIIEDPLAIVLDDWVMDQARRQLDRWLKQGLNLNISVNVSARSIENSAFYKKAEKIFNGIPAGKITIEILESSAVNDTQRIASVIKQCEKIGLLFSLDDFGTGFSTLSFLKELPVKELKVDRMFVQEMLKDHDSLAIVKSILAMATAFDRSVVAEGVESEAHALALVDLGCVQAQGYHYAEPMCEEEFRHWLRKWQAGS